MNEQLIEDGISWASSHGLLMVTDAENGECSHAPMSLLPTQLSKSAFDHAKNLAIPFNVLVDKVARDLDWVYKTLDGVLDHDEFTKRLVDICKKVEEEGVVQRYYLGINRSDYMLDEGKTLLQVELNTIASSFGCLSSRVSRMHHFLLSRYGSENEFLKSRYNNLGKLDEEILPRNVADRAIPKALAAAARHQLNESTNVIAGFPTVLFVVQDGEKNSFDQRWLEYELWDVHGVATIRKSLTALKACAELRGNDKELFVDGHHISVIYFRAGYTPDDYPSEDQWDARLLIERSRAIKCPSIQYHLVGTKKVQQQLAVPGEIERFMGDEIGKMLKTSFAGLWPLDNKQSEIIQKAINDPEKYVVKPQREGGGNNLYGEDAKNALSTMSEEELGAYILMQRIFPAEVDAILVRKGKIVETKALQELGIYGTFLGDGQGKPVFNSQAGHLLRTKAVGVDEGGVATGYSCLDSPYLFH